MGYGNRSHGGYSRWHTQRPVTPLSAAAVADYINPELGTAPDIIIDPSVPVHFSETCSNNVGQSEPHALVILTLTHVILSLPKDLHKLSPNLRRGYVGRFLHFGRNDKVGRSK